ncbi:MAG: sigma-70 factor domain-containing protein, partial [Cyanobacteria bacterium J06621_12]
MTQANQVLATIANPGNDWESLIEEDKKKNRETASVDIKPAAKSKKKSTTKRAERGRKKPYTEDSIRIYLQEIGRIRLLRAEEEIELARQIADLLELERLKDSLEDGLGREATDEEWAREVDMEYR